MPDQWYYSRDGQQQLGPVSGTVLRELAAAGHLGRGDLVWTEGMSQWAPAESTRGIFPAATPSPSAPQLPTAAKRAVEPSASPRQRRVDRDDFRGPANIRRSPGGLSTGAKVALCAGFLGLFLLMAFVAIIAIAVIAEESAQPHNGMRPWARGGRPNFNQPPGGGFMVQPPIPVPPPGYKVTKEDKFEIDLSFQAPEHIKRVQLQQNQFVRITVTTTQWGKGLEPDVDLHIFDPFGNEIASDTLPEKDCKTAFMAASGGQYEFLINLDAGEIAHCIVNYEILNK